MQLNKRLLTIAIIFSSLLKANIAANSTALQNSKWKMIEDTLITQPYEQASGAGARALRWPASIITGAALSKVSYDQLNNLTTIGDKKKLAISLITGLVSAGLINHLIHEVAHNYYEQDSIKNFVKLWRDNKSITPEELHSLFDQLEKVLISENLFEHKAEQTLRYIKIALAQRELAKDANGQSSFFDSKLLNATIRWDFGGILNGIANIIRALTGR